MDKAMTSMPFFRPVTLDPKLASLLISLSHHDGKAPEQIIDPFCGTGCISMQARLRGIPTLSSDLDITMVNGAKENFAYVFDDDYIDYPFVAMDVSRISAHWGRKSNTAFILIHHMREIPEPREKHTRYSSQHAKRRWKSIHVDL